jgi:hypothetical protein
MGAAPKTNETEPGKEQIPRRDFLAWLSGVGIVDRRWPASFPPLCS